MKQCKQKGFTLVEIAIVLVIVGLLLAAVLKGQEMITQGKIKGVINDFNGVLTAYNGYQDRYKAIPGDDSGAVARWSSMGLATSVANGNGVVEGAYTDTNSSAPTTTTTETALFWADLRAAGFYTGTAFGAGSIAAPINSVGGVMGVQSSVLGLNGLAICSTAVPYKIALAADTQLDDGSAKTGTVRGYAYTTAALPALTSAVPATDYTDGSSYVLCRSAT
ncbi:MAG: prepilin-type N-terminal cleavage/methylation domain-containing protein [Burkholderiales bacterium]|nr:prepilin-type N-terminal cleavage/methylation domain-containing protein [Burkholderiales bacterium]